MAVFWSKQADNPVPFRNTAFHQEVRRTAPKRPQRPVIKPVRTRKSGPSLLLVGSVAFVPFALGMILTLKLTDAGGASQPAPMPVAAAPLTAPVAPTAAPAAVAAAVQTANVAPAVQPVPQAAPQPAPVVTGAANPNVVDLQTLVSLSITEDTVTRAEPVDILAPTGPIAAVLAGLQPVAGPASATNLQGGTAETDAAAQEALAAQRDLANQMRMLREGVLAGVYTVETAEFNGTRQLKLRPTNVEVNQRFAKKLLLGAEARGEISFPKGLNTADGDVDLDTMLFTLVQNSLSNDGTVEGTKAAREMTRRAFAASGVAAPQRTGVNADQIYTVKPGDSLAYISLQFYGRPGAYPRIFEANRAIISSPELIKVGQQLVIPG